MFWHGRLAASISQCGPARPVPPAFAGVLAPLLMLQRAFNQGNVRIESSRRSPEIVLQGKAEPAVTKQRLADEIAGAVANGRAGKLQEFRGARFVEEVQVCRGRRPRLEHQPKRLYLRKTEGYGVDGADGFAEQARGRQSDVSVIAERQIDAREPEPLPDRGLYRRQQPGGELRVENIEGFLADGNRAVLRERNVRNRRERAQRRYPCRLLPGQQLLAAKRDPADKAAERSDEREDLIPGVARWIRIEADL